ncbi:MAG: hypothetical protein OHK0013_12010 [Sandaracinaceae bacterium]
MLLDLGYHAVDLAQFLLGPLDFLSCTASRDGRPASIDDVEDRASVWARAGATWIHLEIGRGVEKRERVVIECAAGRFEANRERLLWSDGTGGVRTLAESPRDWSRTMVEQLDTFARAIDGDAASNELETQLPALRFLEACYARIRLDGVPAREAAR